MRASLDFPPGLFGDDTSFARSGHWRDGSNVRFWLGKPQVIGGWELLTPTALAGVCRNILNWSDNASALNVAFGTHSHLQVHAGGELSDVTPTLARPSATLPAAPFAVSDGSPTVTVTHRGHGLETGDAIVVSGSAPVARITPAGSYPITVVDADHYTIAHAQSADTVKPLGSNPLSVTAGSPQVTVNEPGHNVANGETVTIAGATAVGGITPNGTFAVTVVDANSYRYSFTSNATGTATGGGAAVTATVPASGGGAAVAVAPQLPFQDGAVDGAGGAGFGTGAFSTGTYSSPSTEEYFPRTWALSALGQNLIANPRGGAIYRWANDLGVRAAPVANSPRETTFALVGPNDEVFAFGCSEEFSGRFNPLCIRHSGLRDAFGPNETVWRTSASTTAREYILPGGGRIVGARLLGGYVLVWTSHALFLGQFVGALDQIWRFDRVGQSCGLIGPNAAVVVGQSAFWLGPDLQFRRYDLGAAPVILPCPIGKDLAENLAPVQGDKIVASSVSSFNEIRFDYPDGRDGTANSRYLAASVPMLSASPENAWHRGRMARSAMVDAGPAEFPIGVGPGGQVYWHEKGHSADGGPLAWFIESCDQHISPEVTGTVMGVWPDFAGQVGPVNISVFSRLKPQGEERSQGPKAMAVGEDKVDLRLSGRLFRIQLAGEASPTAMRLGRLAVDFAAGGGR